MLFCTENSFHSPQWTFEMARSRSSAFHQPMNSSRNSKRQLNRICLIAFQSRLADLETYSNDIQNSSNAANFLRINSEYKMAYAKTFCQVPVGIPKRSDVLLEMNIHLLLTHYCCAELLPESLVPGLSRFSK